MATQSNTLMLSPDQAPYVPRRLDSANDDIQINVNSWEFQMDITITGNLTVDGTTTTNNT